MLKLKEFLTHYGRLSSSALLILMLAGCGSGGGSDNILCGGDPCSTTGDTPDTPNSSDGTISIGSGSGATFVAGSLTTDLGAVSLTPSGSTVISVSVADQNGTLVTDSTTITFTSTCASQGTAVFDRTTLVTTTGTESVTYTAQGCVGADTITATSGALAASVTITVDAEVISIGSGSGANYTPGVMETGIGAGATLSAGGQTTISATIANQQGILKTASAQNPTEVTFTSGCVSQGLASFSSPSVFTTTGGASVTYTDLGCGAAPDGTVDTISATALGSNASVDITVAPDTVNQVQFISATPAELFLRGTGGNETSLVTFRVRGQLGGPVIGADVNFTLSTEVGGLSLASSSGTTNNLGEVSVTVQSGTVPTSVRITATDVSTGISTLSDGLTVATGIADSDNFSVIASEINPECWTGVQGGTVQITALVADVFNNPPPDGTVVQFVSEGGFVEGSCDTTGGSCFVTFTCSPVFVADGRIEILGYTIGAESFDDFNTDGVFGAGDVFNPANNDLSEAFRDDNENGIYDDIQNFDFNVNGMHDVADGLYTGPACDGTNTVTACSGNSTLHVFDSVTLVQSTPSATPLDGSELVPAIQPATRFDVHFPVNFFDPTTGLIDLPAGGSANLGFFVVGDSNFNSLPNGTSIAVSATNGRVVGGTSFTVLNTTRPAFIPLSIAADDTPSADGELSVSITVPGYGAQVFSWPVDDI